MKKLITYLILSLTLSLSSLSQINESKILPSDGAANDQFGVVSISGDHAIVGAPNNDSTGAAYVFRLNGSNWIEEQKLVASDGAKGDGFGFPVSISDDYAVIGAPNNDSTGAVYVFEREGSDWIEQQKLQVTGFLPYFTGSLISLSGDYIIIGAPSSDSSRGSAYVFWNDGDNWIEAQKLSPSDSITTIYFGGSVSIFEDRAIIGAVFGNFLMGSAYIFRREGTIWIEEQKITARDSAAYFGLRSSVSISGDYAVVGSYGSSGNSTFSGAAYVFRRDGTNWTEEQKLFASDGANNDWFGFSVSISDGYIIVGAFQDDDDGSASGSAYIFRQQGTTWIEEQKLTASDADTSDIFGVSVSVSGENAIVGAPLNGDNGENSGSAYIYNGFVVGVENEETEIPISFKLKQNFPNPFNPSTTIKFSLPTSGYTTLKIYNALGAEVTVLMDNEMNSGTYEIEWNATGLPSGVYFYQLKTEEFVETKKMILMK